VAGVVAPIFTCVSATISSDLSVVEPKSMMPVDIF